MADTKPDAIPDKAATTAVDEFMLAEYQTIAAAHFDLHNGLRQNFRFYLGLIAAPVTVFAVYKDPNIEVFKLPEVMLFLFSVISVLGFLMFLNMINTRFDIILYTRAVNGVRAYFKVRADESANAAFERGRKLPVDKNRPPYNEGWDRAYTWIFILIGFVNSAYFYVVLKNLERAQVFVTWRGGVREGVILLVLLHFFAYLFLSRQREGRRFLELQIPNKNVGVDLDGVIADIVRQLVRFSRSEYDLRLVPSKFRSENIETCTPIKAEQLRKLFCEPKFFQTMRAVQGARRALMQLIAAGYTVHIITDRFWYPQIQDDTRKWLSSRLIRVNSLVFARKTEKQAVARNLEIGWFIEDQRSNANLLSEVCRVLLIDQPYNQGLLAPDVLRVKTLQLAIDTIAHNFIPGTAPADESLLQRIG